MRIEKEKIIETSVNTPLKILLFDCETAPNLGLCWGKYEQTIIDYEREWYMMSIAYKWLDEDKINVFALPDFALYKKEPENDKELVTKLWEVMNEAHILVAHNANGFDIKKANSRFVINELGPPSPYRVVDTLSMARKYFGFNSNKLNDLGKTLGLGEKVETGGFKLWKDCMSGDKKAWDRMKSYNKTDVDLLEKVYLKLRLWDKSHPNVGIFNGPDACHVCGSENVQKRGYSYTQLTKRQRLYCIDCRYWSQGKVQKLAV